MVRRIRRDPSHFEAGLEEISKAINSAKKTVNSFNSQQFIDNHRKLRDTSLKKTNLGENDSMEFDLARSRQSLGSS
jgi:hypothetical protein